MSRSSPETLFAEGDLSASLNEHIRQILDQVNAILRDQFMISSDDEIVAHIRSKMLVEALDLHEESMVMDQQETQIDVSRFAERNPFGDRGPIYVPGVRVTVSIPFTGDLALWKLKPSRWCSVFPRGVVRAPRHSNVGYLDIITERPADVPTESFKQEIDRTLNLVRDYLANQRRDVERHNTQLEGHIRREVQGRRERLEKQEGIAKLLDIPLKRRDGVPEMKPIRVQRRLVRPLPPSPKSGFKPEPGITDSDYEDILAIIRHEGRTFETTPTTYAVHDENDLRNILLAHLNGHYEGSATGETFRFKGKTDIRIEAEDRAAFVAECKVWRGSKSLADAVDQLLGYLTWRDCKCAIVVFNKHNARFSELLDKMPEVFREHLRLYKDLDKRGQGEWRYILTSEEDEARRIVVHVFLFNLYVA